jgi:hypothetical protein
LAGSACGRHDCPLATALTRENTETGIADD